MRSEEEGLGNLKVRSRSGFKQLEEVLADLTAAPVEDRNSQLLNS